jgi:hypothetical protein
MQAAFQHDLIAAIPQARAQALQLLLGYLCNVVEEGLDLVERDLENEKEHDG